MSGAEAKALARRLFAETVEAGKVDGTRFSVVILVLDDHGVAIAAGGAHVETRAHIAYVLAQGAKSMLEDDAVSTPPSDATH